MKSFKWENAVGVFALLLFLVAQYMAIFTAPAERHMMEVVRILFVHVPAAWIALVTFTLAFIGATGFLISGRRGLDWFVEATTEVGVVMTTLLITLGSLFAKPTWNVWWVWEPRLTSTATMLLSFVGILVLRSTVRDADRRAVFSAAATILSFVNVPIVYFSVRWWVTVHQIQSSPATVDPDMVFVLRANAFAFLFIAIWMIAKRWRIAKMRGLAETAPPLPPEVTP